MCPHLKLWACKVFLNHEDIVEELKCVMLISMESCSLCPLVEEKDFLHQLTEFVGWIGFFPCNTETCFHLEEEGDLGLFSLGYIGYVN